MVWGTKPLQVTLLCILTIAQGVLPAINLWIGKLIIDGVVHGVGRGIEAFYEITYLIFILLGINIISSLITYGNSIIQTLLGDLVAHKIKIQVVEKSTSLDLFYFDDSRFYDKLTRAQQEASSRPLMIISTFFKLIKNNITIASMIVVLLKLHWGAVVLLLISGIPFFIMQSKYAEKGYSLLFSQTQDSRKRSYIFHILTSISHFKEIKIFNLGGYLIEQYTKIFDKTFNENKRLVLKKNISAFFVSLLSSVSYLSVYAYAIYIALSGKITLGDLTLYAGAFSSSQGMINSIIANLTSLYENNLFVNNLFTFLNLKPQVIAPATPLPLPEQVQRSIEFKNVGFKYPGSEKWVLKDLNLIINRDENISIVGDNGAGKTTIIKLLSRMYDPQEGEILIDGIDIKEYDPQKYQQMIGIIFQDFSQFYLSAGENVGLGNIDEIDNRSKIETAATKSGAHRVIEKLPHGYDSVLGKYFDEGNELSVGEWQKIAMARAFIRDSNILILDEPTASIDVKTEYDVFQNFKELVRNKISVLISHRFSITKMSDRIYVIQNGTAIESGSHDQLMSLEGKYFRMFTTQAENYQ